ncbi:MAG TPA: hypothetical protein VES60_02430 [Nakamurella sp.]|nr:hypothetical protein [Nakamurella sp.]
MPTTFREYLSDRLLRAGSERALESRELEQGIATESVDSPGYATAARAVNAAKRIESAVLWLGWRLHPRTFSVDRTSALD